MSDPTDLGEIDSHELFVPSEPENGRHGVAELIEELIEVVERAKSMPLSSSAIIAREEVLGMLEAAREELPGELLNARRVLQDHEELRVRAEREADELLDAARSQAQYLVQRTEIVRQARHHAERIVEQAEADGRRVRHEADDYVDRKLAAFEIVLDRTMRTVHAGRERLTVVPTIDSDGGLDELSSTSGAEEAFFDQDLS